MGSLPSAPHAGTALAGALGAPAPDMGRLAALVEGDPALASRVVHFVNSPCYGVSRRVLDVPTALEYLGVGTLRHLVLTIRVRTTFPARSLPARAAEDLERHARLTAHIARQLVDGPAQADAAFLGGLLHDSGKLVLLDRLADAFREATARARRSGRPLHEEERALMGVSHEEIGAYLLGLWGLPEPVVEAVAFHHDLPQLTPPPIGSAVAVAAASFLAHAAPGTLPPWTRSPIRPCWRSW
jgi:HD-like signal output (HDOD) protein